ncbi:MAG: hypothetical protein D6695_06265 [Planctomycetota bacterium]|nr:MAG: hypothetical protein D6695_06265 [Planctomycetota bacterium]
MCGDRIIWRFFRSGWQDVSSGVAALCLGAWLNSVLVQPACAQVDREAEQRCLQCHGRAHIAELSPAERLTMVGTWLGQGEPPAPAEPVQLTGDEPETRPGLLVSRDDLLGSPHADVNCVDCHVDAARLPHSARLNMSSCAAECHTRQWDEYHAGEHFRALQQGSEVAPTCVSCHGGHDMLHVSERRAPQHRLNRLFLCGDCHEKLVNGQGNQTPVQSYLASTHARGVTDAGLLFAATCSDCHGAHGVFAAEDERSPMHRTRIPDSCGMCHEGVNEVYATSIHGQLLAQGDLRGPVCTDCHSAHGISDATTSAFLLDVINECGRCHEYEGPDRGKSASFYETYRASYHGQVTELGSLRAARCSDCHGFHDVLPASDPGSRVHPDNIIATCAQSGCHPSANANFVKFDPHADYRDGERYPILHAVWIYFIIVMSAALGFFGLHSILWFARASWERLRGRGPKKHPPGPTSIRRFTTMNRINHVLVMITFFGLTATGIPLIFSEQKWAGILANLFGGVVAAGVWHRIFATMLIINFIIHFVHLGISFARRTGSAWEWLFGPNSMMPKWRDVTDAAAMIRWFVRGGKTPRFDRWAYWEKFDYWAEIFGSIIIGGSGLLLWFPEIASLFLPGWIFNVAMVVHGYEALLAIGFIFTIHFFNAHLRPGKFPVDRVIFTGALSEEELKEERPDEYERLVATGRLEALRVPTSPAERGPALVIVSIILVGIGLALISLIILGGLRLLGA